ncbi:MAG TPA: YheC/YheD family protein, partial [Metabacillus sp.]|nr:YheC/YheD family protein [Metabacillus sp.]
MRKKYNYPIIGICVSNAQPSLQRLVKKRIHYFRSKATFITFNIKDLNFRNSSVKGNYLEKNKGIWKKGTLPFPDVIYFQSHVDLNIVNKIKKVIGNKVFNTFTLDKLSERQLLAKSNRLQQHLPNTKKVGNKIHLLIFLAEYKNIFLKPIYGSSSKGLIRVERQETGRIIAMLRKNKTT